MGREDKNDIKNRFSADRGSDRLVDVIGQLHDVCAAPSVFFCADIALGQTIVYNMENKFEGVRNHARLGRNELVRSAVADLGSIRAERLLYTYIATRFADQCLQRRPIQQARRPRS